MISIYYAILVAIAVPVYVLSTVYKEKKNRIGIACCYSVLFFLILLFI